MADQSEVSAVPTGWAKTVSNIFQKELALKKATHNSVNCQATTFIITEYVKVQLNGMSLKETPSFHYIDFYVFKKFFLLSKNYVIHTDKLNIVNPTTIGIFLMRTLH